MRKSFNKDSILYYINYVISYKKFCEIIINYSIDEIVNTTSKDNVVLVVLRVEAKSSKKLPKK